MAEITNIFMAWFVIYHRGSFLFQISFVTNVDSMLNMETWQRFTVQHSRWISYIPMKRLQLIKMYLSFF
jgi:hypothetical protein